MKEEIGLKKKQQAAIQRKLKRQLTSSKTLAFKLGEKRGVKRRITNKNLPNVFIKTEVNSGERNKKANKTEQEEFVNNNLYPIDKKHFNSIKKEMFKYGPYTSFCKNCNNKNQEFYEMKRPKEVSQLVDFFEKRYKPTGVKP